jgi:hypothetical protein
VLSRLAAAKKQWRQLMTDNVSRSTEGHDPIALPDLSKEALLKFVESDGSALANSVRRVIEDAKTWTQNYSAFGNTP